MIRMIAGAVLSCLFFVAPSLVFAGQNRPQIAVVVKLTGIPWFNRMEVGVKEAAQDLNVNAFQTGATTADPTSQAQIIEDLINRGVNAICVDPNDIKSLDPVLERARQKGIIVLSHENPLDTNAVNYDVEAIDSVTYAENAIDQIAENLKAEGRDFTPENPAGYVQLVGGLTVPLHKFWADTAEKYAAMKYPWMKELTARLPTAESVQDSRSAVLDLITTYGNKLDAVIGWGSLGPIGAAQAVAERRLENQIVVVGSAIPSTAVPYLTNGSMKFAELWDPKDAGYALVYVADQLIKKQPLRAGEMVPNLGRLSIKEKVVSVNDIKDMMKAKQAAAMGF